ncbi:MAG: hypothetical protein WAU99_03810 [Pseudolabrys sp.]
MGFAFEVDVQKHAIEITHRNLQTGHSGGARNAGNLVTKLPDEFLNHERNVTLIFHDEDTRRPGSGRGLRVWGEHKTPKALLAAEIAAHQGDLGAILLPRHLTLDAVDCPDAKADLTRHLADAGATSKMAR